MKTKFKLAGVFGILFALMTFFTGTAKAQCNDMVQNLLNCSVDVIVDVYEMDPLMGTCTQLCKSYPANLGPGVIMPVNCAGCPNFCNIVVTVRAINGVPVTLTSADFSTNPPGNVIGPGNLPCAPVGSSMYIYYDTATMTFIIHF